MLNRFVVVYLDGILIHSRTYCEHVELVSQHLRDHGLSAKAEKREFHKKKFSFLSYCIGLQGVSMEKDKVEPVTKLAGAAVSEGATKLPWLR